MTILFNIIINAFDFMQKNFHLDRDNAIKCAYTSPDGWMIIAENDGKNP